MDCPEWMTAWWQGGVCTYHIHWLWAIPFIFVVAGAICALFLMWRAAPRLMHPWSDRHIPQWPHAPFGDETVKQWEDKR